MKVGYTEFSFGYAFTENLIRSSPMAPVGAPVFPNLIQEGKSGFDININFPGAPLFLQYKLPELMRMKTAFEVANWHCPGLSVPFFRISMMRRDISRQHDLLMRLESRFPNNVFYAAPCIASVAGFNRAYNLGAVAHESVFFSPSEIGRLPDDKSHSIAYQTGLAFGFFCSEPKKILAKTFQKLSALFSVQMQERRFNRLSESAQEIRESVLELASPQMRESEQFIVERIRTTRLRLGDSAAESPKHEQAITDVLVAREIARVDLGVDLLIAQSR